MDILNYPFDPQLILKKRKSIKKNLIGKTGLIPKKIAILGGSTTHDIKDVLELFLLNYGIKPEFYESEYEQYYQDVMFNNEELKAFQPDFVYLHTCNRNITAFPTVKDSTETVETLLENEYNKFVQMWEKIEADYHCVLIQNNFEMPFYRLLGNRDASDIHGRTNFLNRLNERFYTYAQSHPNFFINDLNYLSASYGLAQWSDPFYWHMYKYCVCVPAIPYLAFSLANIVKSVLGKNKKSLVLDLDNTLWGGVVGDDGIEGIEIGHETSTGQVYTEFQQYLKDLKDIGVMLNVNSKNDYENAIAGLNHPEGTLRPDDFIVIKANWQNKDVNLKEIVQELNILPESMVFVDDNPAEREIVRSQVPGVAAPELDSVEKYINILDKSGFFEVTNFSQDDLKRNEMYKANAERAQQLQSFQNYDDYLLSLNMRAVIRDFDPVYISRIAQLTNKSNQFNLTTKRFTQGEMETISHDSNYIRLYGKLEDKFGDNGVITVVIGKKEGDALHMTLWLMSCRVLKRHMEDAMLDRIVEEAKAAGLAKIRGYYYPTAKNKMVQNFYADFGFTKVSADEAGNTVWEMQTTDYQNKNHVIKVEKGL